MSKYNLFSVYQTWPKVHRGRCTCRDIKSLLTHTRMLQISLTMKRQRTSWLRKRSVARGHCQSSSLMAPLRWPNAWLSRSQSILRAWLFSRISCREFSTMWSRLSNWMWTRQIRRQLTRLARSWRRWSIFVRTTGSCFELRAKCFVTCRRRCSRTTKNWFYR